MSEFTFEGGFTAKAAVSRRRWFEVELVQGSGFEMLLTHLSRTALRKLANRNTKKVWDRKANARIEQLDEDRLFDDYAKNIVIDWRGLDVGILKQLLSIDTDAPDETNVPYSKENVTLLLKGCIGLDTWVTDGATDPMNFTEVSKEDEVLEGNS